MTSHTPPFDIDKVAQSSCNDAIYFGCRVYWLILYDTQVYTNWVSTFKKALFQMQFALEFAKFQKSLVFKIEYH